MISFNQINSQKLKASTRAMLLHSFSFFPSLELERNGTKQINFLGVILDILTSYSLPPSWVGYELVFEKQ